MTPEFAYLLKVNVAFVLFYAFYRLFFYKDTFFKLRRAILLAFFGLALFYPLLNIQDWVRQQEPIADVIYMYSAMLPEATAKADAAASVDWYGWLLGSLGFIYWGIVAFLSYGWLIPVSVLLFMKLRFMRCGRPPGHSPFSVWSSCIRRVIRIRKRMRY